MSVIAITPKRFEDARGWFTESWNRSKFREVGIDCDFCQDNHSYSMKAGTLRGLHFQKHPNAQAKLVRCLRGRIFDVAVDIRADSPTFGEWLGVELSAKIGNQLFIPSGYAHGFLTLEDHSEVAYKTDKHYSPEDDAGIIWNDDSLNINWPVEGLLFHLSEKDSCLPHLSDAIFHFEYDGKPLRKNLEK